MSLPNIPLSLAAFSLLTGSGAAAFAQSEAPSIDIEVCNSLDAGEVSSILEGESQQPATSIAISCADEIATVRVARRDSTIVVLQADLRVVEPIARARTIALLIAEMKPLEARVGQQLDPQPASQPAVVLESELSNEAYFATHLLQLSTELGFASREFQYEGSGNSPEIPSYSGAAVPTTKLRVEVNPWHNSNSSLQGFGARISYGFALPFESYGSEMVAIDTRWREWEASLRAQKRLASSVIGVELGLGAQQFEFVETASNWAITVDLPGVDYRYRRIGVDAGVPVSDVLALELALEYRLVNNIGAIGQHFNATEASAWAGTAALRYRITNDFSAQLSYKAARYEQTYSMALGSGNASGQDSFDSLLLGLRAGI